jgi:hypothetical protein
VAWAWRASMLRFGEGVEAGSASPRVDWPVYPRHVEHSTIGEGAIDDVCRADPCPAGSTPMSRSLSLSDGPRKAASPTGAAARQPSCIDRGRWPSAPSGSRRGRGAAGRPWPRATRLAPPRHRRGRGSRRARRRAAGRAAWRAPGLPAPPRRRFSRIAVAWSASTEPRIVMASGKAASTISLVSAPRLGLGPRGRDRRGGGLRRRAACVTSSMANLSAARLAEPVLQ